MGRIILRNRLPSALVLILHFNTIRGDALSDSRSDCLENMLQKGSNECRRRIGTNRMETFTWRHL